MFISDSKNPVSVPEQAFTLPDGSKKVEKGENAFDFDKMLSESNVIKQGEFEKEKNSVGDGEFHVGETKSDKEFREQLEKITGKKQDKLKSKLDQNDYLTLLVTQLKYQDPGKPMEHYEMASQMAQFNTVEQLVGMNKTLTNLSKTQSEAKLDKLSQYLDKFVEVQGNNLKLNENNTTSVARFDLPMKASNVSIEVKDSQSKTVRNIPLGEMQSGTHDIEWDGKNAQGVKALPGNYTFVVNAVTEDGKPITVKSSYLAKVNGVTDILSGGKLDTTAGSIEPNKIISVRNYEPSKLINDLQKNSQNISAKKDEKILSDKKEIKPKKNIEYQPKTEVLNGKGENNGLN